MTYLYRCPDCGHQTEIAAAAKADYDAGISCQVCQPRGLFLGEPEPHYRRVYTAPALTTAATPTRN